MSLKLRPLLFQLHLYLAIAIGLYVAILGVTGSILAFGAEIDHLTHANLAYVTPAPPRLNLATLGEAVAKAYPGQRIFGYDLGEGRNLATRVAVGATARSIDQFVYVNPYTGHILGSRPSDGGVLDVIQSIHVSLAPSWPGRSSGLARSFVAWTCFITLFVLLSGIWLWWPRMRFGIRAGGGRPFWYDLHATLGIAAVAFLVLLTVSGTIMGFSNTTQPLLDALTGSQPLPDTKLPSPPAGGTQPIPFDRAFAIAAKALPGATPIAIFGPNREGAYFVSARSPGDHDLEARSGANIDAYTGAVLDSQILDTAPAGWRAWIFNRTIHFGTVFGTPGKAIMALASLIIALQVVSGIVMWIKRVSFREMIPALAVAAAVTGIAVYTVLAATV